MTQRISEDIWNPDIMNNHLDWLSAFGVALELESVDISKIIKTFIAADEGIYDYAKEWICLYETYDNRYAKLTAGCCYTGFDVQANGKVEYYPTLPELFHNLTKEETLRVYCELRELLVIQNQWLTSEVIRLANDFDDQDELPLLGDAFIDAGASDEIVAWFHNRNLWALFALKEHCRITRSLS